MNNKKLSAKDHILLANLILAVLIWIGDCLFLRYGGLKWKTPTSVLFVAIGAVNLAYLLLNKNKNIKFPILMVTGLTFAMLGDVVLEIQFIVGAALFAVGHVFYFVAYSVMEKIKPTDLIYALCLFVPSVLLITLAPIFDFGGALMEVVCVVYAAVISCMVGKAIANFVRVKSRTSLIIALGSILFFISDFTLLFNVFTSLPYVGALCLATYYPAEILLGFSIFMFGMEVKKSEPLNTAENADAVTDKKTESVAETAE